MLQITSSPDLSKLTTLRLGGNAIALIDVFEEKDLEQLPQQVQSVGGEAYVLGGGSNILAAGNKLPFVLIRTKILQEPVVTHKDSEGNIFVRVCAAMGLPRFLAWCCKEGFSGMEGLAGIPGTVGGAIAGNAGSYGLSMCDCIHEVEIFFFDKGMQKVKKDTIQYGYRTFSINETLGKFVIIAATVVLQQKPKQQLVEIVRKNVAKKTRTQPVQAKSAGCIFKNPEFTVSAGNLLEQAGFRGKSKDGMCFSPLHANFLVNKGDGSSTIAFELVQEAKQTVSDFFNVELQTEVKVWTC